MFVYRLCADIDKFYIQWFPIWIIHGLGVHKMFGIDVIKRTTPDGIGAKVDHYFAAMFVLWKDRWVYQ